MKTLAIASLAMFLVAGCGAPPGLETASLSKPVTARSVPGGRSLASEDPYLRLAIDARTKYFHQADQDDSGGLTLAEFKPAILIGRFDQFDVNRDGLVTLPEFTPQQEVERTRIYLRMHVEYAFPRLDANGDGKLSRAELTRCSVAMEQLDADQDGGVTLKELEAYDLAQERQILDTAEDYFLAQRTPYVIPGATR